MSGIKFTSTDKNAKTIDPNQIQELRNLLSNDVLLEIIESYITTTKDYLTELHEAIEEEDVQSCHKIAHKLKSSSLSIGATAVGNLCIHIEKTFDLKKLKGKITLLIDSFQQSKDDLIAISKIG